MTKMLLLLPVVMITVVVIILGGFYHVRLSYCALQEQEGIYDSLGPRLYGYKKKVKRDEESARGFIIIAIDFCQKQQQRHRHYYHHHHYLIPLEHLVQVVNRIARLPKLFLNHLPPCGHGLRERVVTKVGVFKATGLVELGEGSGREEKVER